ncbi:hypothetical protein [Microbacterium rhizosphaerae]|uniref:DUF222 domain-containing protein n=1 Tax=Microbacterium rhizosphaerae TaxID=1678237 RepID=A0ABZ0SME2_9MICO|nr:hypothetical protein [Microbacterium rhizosphaerae]WPR89374.1 hypothetical protein SM116_16685 [Microbacterium rhizosphaerae]
MPEAAVPHPTDADMTTALRRAFTTCGELSDALRSLAAAPVSAEASLRADEEATRTAEGRLAFAVYVQQRATAAATYLDELHRSALRTAPGELALDLVLLPPLLRGAIENAATLTWLLAPETRQQRLERFARALRADVSRFAADHERLAQARDASIPPQLYDQLASRLAEHGDAALAHIDAAALAAGVTTRAVRRELPPSVPVAEAYGDGSLPHVAWTALADLTHFGFTLAKNDAELHVETDTRQSSLVVYALVAVTTARDALAHLSSAMGMRGVAASIDPVVDDTA